MHKVNDHESDKDEDEVESNYGPIDSQKKLSLRSAYSSDCHPT